VLRRLHAPAVMAMPHMEQTRHPTSFLTSLAVSAKAIRTPAKTIYNNQKGRARHKQISFTISIKIIQGIPIMSRRSLILNLNLSANLSALAEFRLAAATQ